MSRRVPRASVPVYLQPPSMMDAIVRITGEAFTPVHRYRGSPRPLPVRGVAAHAGLRQPSVGDGERLLRLGGRREIARPRPQIVLQVEEPGGQGGVELGRVVGEG